jgi:hypothetical protein
MAKFIEIKEKFEERITTNLLSASAINYVFNNEGNAIFCMGNKYIITENDFNEVYQLLSPYQFSITELNGTTIKVRGVNTQDKGIKAIINLNNLAYLYGSWQGELDFIDGTTVESYFSPSGSIESLKLKYKDYILRKK